MWKYELIQNGNISQTVICKTKKECLREAKFDLLLYESMCEENDNFTEINFKIERK